MKTITKEQYMELLENQRQQLKKKVEAAEEDLSTLETAITDLKSSDFNKVEVIENNGAFTFNIVE